MGMRCGEGPGAGPWAGPGVDPVAPAPWAQLPIPAAWGDFAVTVCRSA